MATIGSYTAAATIDASNDFLLIQTSGVYKKINRNVFLALASAPLGTSDSQSPTNKTFDNTNAYTIKDGSLTLQNTSSATKQAVFSLASITAGQTRTITVPDASLTLVGTATTQTLTNKTITSPAITGGTIDNSTVTVDSISGHSSATVVTVANLQISNGVLNSANAVTATSIAAGAVQPQALVTGTGSGWSWQSYTPTLANITIGNGSTTGKYIQIGKTIFFRVFVAFGTTSSMGSNPTITLPVTAVNYGTGSTQVGMTWIDNTGVANYQGPIAISGAATTFNLQVYNVAGTYITESNFTASVPFSWANGSTFACFGTYEVA